MSKVTLEPDFGDPYNLLGLEQTATESDINKAFRKLSLQLHPDKQTGKSEREKTAIAKRFHDINQAKEFLLDPTRRQPYDVQRGSKLRRQQQDKQREAYMSEHRRKMKQDLAEREARLKAGEAGKDSQSMKNSNQDVLLQKLRKEGKRRRDEHAEKAANEEYTRLKKMRNQEMRAIKSRQIRLKWSRKRITNSPSEHSLAAMLSSQFGNVVKVEMIGIKGNQAVVTFESRLSCQPCVDFFIKHQEMRAFMVLDDNDETQDANEEPLTKPSTIYDHETIHEHQLRQADERERLSRELDNEERSETTAKLNQSNRVLHPFPLDFPMIEEVACMGPFEKLQYFERNVFDNLISKGLIAPNQTLL